MFLKKKLALLDKKNIPEHIAIMMDGNRRWAKKRGKSFFFGYKKGAKNLENIVEAASFLEIKVLTVYAFSTENWKRKDSEVQALMNLFENYLNKYGNKLKKENIRLKAIGDLSRCPKNLEKVIRKLEEETKNGSTMDLVLAINYGGRNEITRAIKKIVIDYKNNKIDEKDIKDEFLSEYLDTSFCSDPDMLIRTSGENRLSNFLLWQMSYAEFLVTDVLWPEFSQDHFLDAILEYQKRDRRFGRE